MGLGTLKDFLLCSHVCFLDSFFSDGSSNPVELSRKKTPKKRSLYLPSLVNLRFNLSLYDSRNAAIARSITLKNTRNHKKAANQSTNILSNSFFLC